LKHIKTSDEFCAWLVELGHPLPWDVTGGFVLDAVGARVAEIPYYGGAPEDVSSVGLAIVLAVNLCGSFRPDVHGEAAT
jgi:hypothetical protein